MAGRPPRPGRPGSGGRRSGKQGGSYANRTDLRQGVRTAPGQDYGVATQQAQAQQAIPLSAGSPPPAAPAAPSPGPVQALAARMGGGGPSVVPLTAPTTRPNEPLTAGLPGGPGPGPEALGMQGGQDATLLGQLRGYYQASPNSDLARLIAFLESKQ